MFSHRTFFFAGAAVGAALLLPSSAQADLKVTSLVTVKGVPKNVDAGDTSKPITTTAYYKGDKSRTEAAGTTIITDLAVGKMYTLDNAKKTFTVANLNDLATAAGGNPFLNNIKVTSTTTVKAEDQTKALLGKNAKLYNYTSNFAISVEGNDALNAFMPKITIAGQMWNDEALILPGDPRKMAQATYMRMLPAQIRRGVTEMSDKLSAMKGFPLLSVVTVTVTPPKDAPDFVKEQMPKEPIVTTTEVTSISEDALPDTLFVVPADFKETKPAPAVPVTP